MHAQALPARSFAHKAKALLCCGQKPFVLRSTAKELHLFAAKVLLHCSNIFTMISSTRHIKGALSFATRQIADPSFAHPEKQSSGQRLMRLAALAVRIIDFPRYIIHKDKADGRVGQRTLIRRNRSFASQAQKRVGSRVLP